MDTTRPSLLIRIRDPGDWAAWQTFNELYRPLLIRYARQRGLDHNAAEDVAQDCLESISRRIESFDYDPGRGRFKSWLSTLVHNRVCNLLRGNRERPADIDLFAETGDGSPAPDELFEQMWMEQHLWHCLRELEQSVDATTYHAFIAFVIEQRPLSEVCEELNLKPNNVYTIKWRLTQRIAERMRELLDDDDT